MIFDPGKERFGFYISMPGHDKRYTEFKRNRGKASIKVFPMIQKGQITDSYLICWENYWQDIRDYIIVGVSGIKPVTIQSFHTNLSSHGQKIENVIDPRFIDRKIRASTETDSEGTFRLEHLIEGEYRLAIMADEKLLPSDAKKVKVVNAQGRIILNAQNPTVDLGEIKIMVAK